MYKEKPAPSQAFWLLAGIFLLLTVPNAWLPELSRDEAVTAMMARDLYHYGSFIQPSLLGQQTIHPPLASWVLAIIGFFLGFGELTVRLVDIVALGGLGALSGFMIYRIAGIHAAGIAAASVISSVISLQMGISGEGHVLFALLINAAWFTFYHLSRMHKQWLYAWFFSHLLLLLAMLAGGPKALFYFYLPLFFLRRPLNVLRRMRKLDHLTSLFVLVAALSVWLLMVPHVSQNVVLFFRDFEPQQATAGYLGRVVRFPFRFLLAVMPWALLAWPAFCMAFRPLERDSTLALYCRTIVWTFVLFFWLLPEGHVSDLLPLLGPLGVLAGMNYAILVRRHGDALLWLPRLLGWAAIAAAIVVSTYAVIFISGELIADEHLSLYVSIFFLVTGVVMAIFLVRNPRSGPVWFVLLLAVTSLHLVWVSSVNLHKRLYGNEYRAAGRELAKVIPEDAQVYVYTPGGGRHNAALFYYVERPTVQVEQLQQLPLEAGVIYLVTSDIRPISANWEWGAISDAYALHDRNLRVWRGTRRRN